MYACWERRSIALLVQNVSINGGKPHALAFLPPEKEPQVLIELETGTNTQPAWSFWRRENFFFAPAEFEARKLVTISNMLAQLQLPSILFKHITTHSFLCIRVRFYNIQIF
jgi:hypothetical protein